MISRAERLADILHAKKRGAEFIALCPAHDDSEPSLSFRDAEDGKLLVTCRAGCSQEAVVRAVKSLGATLNGAKHEAVSASQIVATYDYRDAFGDLIYQVIRRHPKDFRQRRPDGSGGWIDNLHGVERMPYRLPALIEAVQVGRPVYVVEGEKDADALGIDATTNSGGAGKWRAEYAQYFRGARVIVMPDADAPGRAHAEQVAASLAPVALSVRVLTLPGLSEKGDVSDWLAAGHGEEEFTTLADAAPIWQPAAAAAKPEGTLTPVAPAPATLNVTTFAVLWYATMTGVAHHDELIKGLLLAGSLLVVFGESNSGKTFCVLDMALAVAAGRPWFGRRTQRGLVVYVAGEGAASVRTRVAAYRKSHTEVDAALPFAVIPQVVDFLDVESVATLIRTIRSLETDCGETCGLVVIDTLARAIPAGDENSTQDMSGAVAAADRIRMEIGTALAFVHHSGKDPTKGARGSNALRAAADTEILVEGTTGTRSATVTKQRDLESGQRFAFDLQTVEVGVDSEDGTPITSCVMHQTDGDAAAPASASFKFSGAKQIQFVAALRERARTEPERAYPLTELREIARLMGMRKPTARSVVDAVANSPYMVATLGGFSDGRAQG